MYVYDYGRRHSDDVLDLYFKLIKKLNRTSIGVTVSRFPDL